MGANADACGRLCLTSVTNALAPRLRVCKCGVFSGVCQQICIFIRFPSGKKEGKERKKKKAGVLLLFCVAPLQNKFSIFISLNMRTSHMAMLAWPSRCLSSDMCTHMYRCTQFLCVYYTGRCNKKHVCAASVKNQEFHNFLSYLCELIFCLSECLSSSVNEALPHT